MGREVLDTVVEQVKTLTYEEQQELRMLLDEIMAKSEDERKRLRYFQRLIDKGMMSEMPRRRMTTEEFDAFKPVEIKGEPMSETIIKDRR